jgi:predicted YcjX-like family ATPase
MLMPGDMEGSPALTFMPLDVNGVGGRSLFGYDSMHAMMSRRFEAYKTHVVKPFFRDHFARLERQIVLVDALSAMNEGATAFTGLERALTATLGCFRSGANSWLTSIMGKRIDRIVFAATKADHIHHTSHDRLEAIMRAVLDRAISRAEFSGAEVRSLAMAAVRSTREVEAAGGADGALGCIAGRPLAGERLDGRTFNGSQEVALFPGDLPASPGVVWQGHGNDGEKSAEKKGQGASTDSVRFLRFAPPAPQATQAQGFGVAAPLPHIRLDRAIQFLIGDKFA